MSYDPRFFDSAANARWPEGPEALDTFLQLTRDDVDEIVDRALKNNPRGRTWEGLLHVLDRDGYGRVRDLGVPVATVWARHLGVIPMTARKPESAVAKRAAGS
jgi:hypothetical protein